MNNIVYGDYTDVAHSDYVPDLAAEPSSSYAVDIRGKHIFLFFILALIVSGLSGISDTSGGVFTAARVILGAALISSVLMPSRYGIPLFLALVLVAPDLTQSASEKAMYGEYNIASIWRFYIGPIRPSWILAACVIIQIIKTRPIALDKRTKGAIIWFVTVPVITGLIYGGFTTSVSSIEVLADIRFGIMLITGVILFHSFFRKHPDMLGFVMALFIGSLLGRCLVDIIYWLTGYGAVMGGVSRASVDSTKSTVIFVLLYAIVMIMRRKKFLLGPIIGIGCVLLIIVYGTRMIWLTSVLCCVILLYIFGAKRAVIAVPIVILLAFGSLKLVRWYQVESLEVVAERARTLTGGGGGSYIESVDPVRYREIVNSMNTSTKRLSFLWGNGYGSYYTEEVISFPLSLLNAFPEYSAATGQFYYLHNFPFQVLFKHGIIGMVIILILWIGPPWECFKTAFNRRDPSLFMGVMGCFLAFVPSSMLNLYWSGKGMLLSGFIIAVLLSIVEQYRQDEGDMLLPNEVYEGSCNWTQQ